MFVGLQWFFLWEQLPLEVREVGAIAVLAVTMQVPMEGTLLDGTCELFCSARALFVAPVYMAMYAQLK